MSALHTSLRLATREQHRRLDSHVLMMALMQPGLTAHVYAAALRGLGGALADCESAIEVAHHRYLTARHELSLPMERRLPLLKEDLEKLGTAPCDNSPLTLKLCSAAELVGAMYVVEGSRLGGQMLTHQLRANGGEHWPCRFFEAGGTASVQRWKQYMQWAEGILGQDDIPAACATAIRVFDLFAHRLDQAAQNLQARA